MATRFESFRGSESERKPIVQEFKQGEWPQRKIPKNESRPPITPELREKMDREIVALGKLMEGSKIWWQLDGSLNISLREIAAGRDYIGIHKDIDFSVFADDLPALREHIESKGYGLFDCYKDEETGKEKYEQIIGEEVRLKWNTKIRVIALNKEHSAIDTNADMPIAGPIICRKGKAGEFMGGWQARVLPEQWMRGETVHVRGVDIPLSHPARFVYFKLFFAGGKYHGEDLEYFVLNTKAVSIGDLEDISRVLERDMARYEGYRSLHKQIAMDIAAQATPGMTSEMLYEVIKRSMPSDYLEKMYGEVVKDDPEGATADEESMMRALSEVRSFSYATFLETLSRISFLDSNEKNLKQAVAFLDSLKKRRTALESK